MSDSATSSYNLNFITLDIISDIQSEIDPSDMISLMFLLYEDPKLALRKLASYQRVVSDGRGSCLELLNEWAAHAQMHSSSWKWKLLDGLATCQLYTVIRKLGFHPPTVKQQLQKSNEISTIDPIRKIFYRVCENMQSSSFTLFKQLVSSENIKILDHDTCEVVFLELLCQKVFTSANEDQYEIDENVGKLLHILVKIPACSTLCTEIKSLCSTNIAFTLSTRTIPTIPFTVINQDRKYEVHDFSEDFKLLDETFENLNLNLKTDEGLLENACGLCYIINQEKFTPGSCNSLAYHSMTQLDDRPESAADKIILGKTMKDHQVAVVSHDNLSREQMFNNIRGIVKKYVKAHHNFFFLCILSHGTRDHVYSADAKQINISEIEDLLDSDDMVQLRSMPKIFLIQACQNDEVDLIADSSRYYIKKSNMITFCSTAPGYEAYRVKGKTSLFIYTLCDVIQKYSGEEHLADMFTKVIKKIDDICSGLRVNQLPIMLRNTLKTKVYLKKSSL